VKEGKEINLGVADSTTAAEDFKYSMRGKVISITYLGPGSISQEIDSSSKLSWVPTNISPVFLTASAGKTG
jgi:hypothetical protein